MNKKIVGFIAGVGLVFSLSACNFEPASDSVCEDVVTGQVVADSFCDDGLDGYEWVEAEAQAEEEEGEDHDKKKKSKSKSKSGFKKK